MQHISSILFSGMIETGDVIFAGLRGVARRLSLFAGNGLSDLLVRVKKSPGQFRTLSLTSKNEIEIMYFGRASEFLKVTSERIVIPAGSYTVGRLLCILYHRGDRWVDELDDSQLVCTVNGREAGLFDTIEPGAEVCISSDGASSGSERRPRHHSGPHP